MAGSAGSIFVDMLLRDASFRQGLNKSRQSVNQFSRGAQSDLARVRGSFVGVLSPVENMASAVGKLGATLAGALSVQKIVQYTDTWRQLEGRLSLVTDSASGLVGVQQELFEIAQRTRQPLEGVLNLYTRLAQAIPESSRGQFDLLGVTESINAALAITGEGSAQASSAILQFTQAVASGFKASSQEINSLLDSAPRLAQALQRSFGDGRKSLKQLSADGELDLETILKSLSAVGAEGQKLRSEFQNLAPTVGQAFTQLDNSFLKFIGQSEAANAGASSLALGIQALANNLDIVANAVIGVSTIIGVRLVGSIAASGAAMLVATSEAIAYQAALARMAGSSTSAAAAMGTLTVATRALSAAMALLGGPVGVALLAAGAIAALAISSGNADNAQQAYNETLGRAEILSNKLITATGKQRDELIKERQAVIEATKAKMELARANFLELASRADNTTGNFITDYFSSNRADKALQKMKAAGEAYKQIQNTFATTSGGFEPLSFANDNKAAKSSGRAGERRYENLVLAADKWLAKEREVIETLRLESQFIGMTAIEVDKLKAAREIETELAEKLVGLRSADAERVREQAEELKLLRQEVMQTNYEVSRSAEAGISNFLTRFQEEATDNAAQIERVLSNAFQGAEDAFIKFTQTGKLEFKSLISSIVEDMLRMQFRQGASSLLGSIFGGAGGMGGGLGSLFGSQGALSRLFATGNAGFVGPMPSFGGFFADGGNLGAGQWGIVGEEGPEVIYGGTTGKTIFPNDNIAGGGNVYNIDARGADQGAVTRLQNALVTLAGPGVIEKRVKNAQNRGSL